MGESTKGINPSNTPQNKVEITPPPTIILAQEIFSTFTTGNEPVLTSELEKLIAWNLKDREFKRVDGDSGISDSGEGGHKVELFNGLMARNLDS